MGFGWEVPHDDSAYLSPLGTNRRATSSGSRLPILNPCHAGRTTKRCSVICGLGLPHRGSGLPPRVFPLLFFDGRQGLYAYVETPLWGPGLPPSTAPASLGCYARNSLWAQTKTPAMRWINLGSPENVRRTLPNVTMRTEGAARFGRLV